MAKMKKVKIFAIVLVIMVLAYGSGPFLAALFKVGNRAGPACYPKSFHENMYTLSHEIFHSEKPRVPFDTWMYKRPLFYGMPRRLKTQEEREAAIDMARRNQSPLLPDMIEMHRTATPQDQLETSR